jgi:hypothetical protein
VTLIARQLDKANGPAVRDQAPETDEAQLFLNWLDPEATTFSFRIFDDDKERSDKCRAENDDRPDPYRTKTVYDALSEHRAELDEYNDRGSGIFVKINRSTGGRKTDDIDLIRALFIDLDGPPLEPVLSGPYPPHLVINTSPGKWHCYWKVKPGSVPLDEFTTILKALIEKVFSDPSIHDRTSVRRVPGV